MRNAFFFYLLPLFPVAVLACTVSANVGDFPALPDAGRDGHAFGDGSADGPSASEAGTDGTAPLSDAGCGVGFAQQGAFIDVQSNPGGPPDYSGGTIVPGVYVLKSMTYFVSMAGTAARRETLNVRGASPNGAFERLVEQRNPTGDYPAIAAHGETSTWMTESPFFLFESPECPSIESLTANYEAAGTTLKLYTGGGQPFERVYERLP